METYPKRPSHFAHKLVRLMLHSCAAQEIGPDGFLVVTAIAHAEDAKRYSGAVTYWNDQLIPILGFGSWGQLDRARKKAIAGGWLHYEEGGKGKVGKYWTTVPAHLLDAPDVSTESDHHVCLANSGEDSVKETGDKRETNVRQPGDNRGTSGEHSTLALIPVPSPTDKELASRHVASWVRPANCREQRHTDALVLWQMARKDKHGSFLSEPSWMAECAKWSHWTADQWSAQLLQSAAHGTLNLATYATNGNGTSKQAKPESPGLGPMKPIRESRNRTPAT